MGRTKDRHLRQERDRGQGWDRSLFDGDPNALTLMQLQAELAKRGLSTQGNYRGLRNRFVRALCVGVKVGKVWPAACPAGVCRWPGAGGAGTELCRRWIPPGRSLRTLTVSFFLFVKERICPWAGGCRPTAGSYWPTAVV